MRLGIFGGTFDPVHCGHLCLAESAEKELNLDRIVFVPAFRSPFKTGPLQRSPTHRLKMLRLAVGKKKNWSISSFELQRNRTSYTINTVRHFARKFPKSELYLILGTDSLKGFKKWKEWRQLVRKCFLVAGKRKGPAFKPDPAFNEKIRFLKSAMSPVSSTGIREKLAAGAGSKQVPKPVLDYIRREGLYAGPASQKHRSLS